MNDEKWMREALELAKTAAEKGEVPVGCVIVCGDRIVGRGCNSRETDKNALHHAEILAIDEACRTLGGWRLWQCTMYVTLEPCVMCAGAILNAQFAELVIGAPNPKAGACASVVNALELPGYHRPRVRWGVLGDECAQSVRAFFAQLREGSRAEKISKEPT